MFSATNRVKKDLEKQLQGGIKIELVIEKLKAELEKKPDSKKLNELYNELITQHVREVEREIERKIFDEVLTTQSAIKQVEDHIQANPAEKDALQEFHQKLLTKRAYQFKAEIKKDLRNSQLTLQEAIDKIERHTLSYAIDASFLQRYYQKLINQRARLFKEDIKKELQTHVLLTTQDALQKIEAHVLEKPVDAIALQKFYCKLIQKEIKDQINDGRLTIREAILEIEKYMIGKSINTSELKPLYHKLIRANAKNLVELSQDTFLQVNVSDLRFEGEIPSLKAAAEYTANLSRLIGAEIFGFYELDMNGNIEFTSQHSVHKRTLVMERWVETLRLCWNRGDQQTAMAIYQALTADAAISRLVATHEGLSPQAKQILDLIKHSWEMEDLYKVSSEFAVPFISTYQKELVLLQTKLENSQSQLVDPTQAENSYLIRENIENQTQDLLKTINDGILLQEGLKQNQKGNVITPLPHINSSFKNIIYDISRKQEPRNEKVNHSIVFQSNPTLVIKKHFKFDNRKTLEAIFPINDKIDAVDKQLKSISSSVQAKSQGHKRQHSINATLRKREIRNLQSEEGRLLIQQRDLTTRKSELLGFENKHVDLREQLIRANKLVTRLDKKKKSSLAYDQGNDNSSYSEMDNKKRSGSASESILSSQLGSMPSDRGSNSYASYFSGNVTETRKINSIPSDSTDHLQLRTSFGATASFASEASPFDPFASADMQPADESKIEEIIETTTEYTASTSPIHDVLKNQDETVKYFLDEHQGNAKAKRSTATMLEALNENNNNAKKVSPSHSPTMSRTTTRASSESKLPSPSVSKNVSPSASPTTSRARTQSQSEVVKGAPMVRVSSMPVGPRISKTLSQIFKELDLSSEANVSRSRSGSIVDTNVIQSGTVKDKAKLFSKSERSNENGIEKPALPLQKKY